LPALRLELPGMPRSWMRFVPPSNALRCCRGSRIEAGPPPPSQTLGRRRMAAAGRGGWQAMRAGERWGAMRPGLYLIASRKTRPTRLQSAHEAQLAPQRPAAARGGYGAPQRPRVLRGTPQRPAAASSGQQRPKHPAATRSGTPQHPAAPRGLAAASAAAAGSAAPPPPLPPLPPCHPGFRRDPPTWPEVPTAHQPPCAPLAAKSPKLPKKWAAVAQARSNCPKSGQ